MAMEKMAELRKAWKKMREVGGSVRDHLGNNLTGSATGESSFGWRANHFCTFDADALESMASQTVEWAEYAAWLQDVNTSPLVIKRYSKPVVVIRPGCKCDVEWTPRNADEEPWYDEP